MRKYVLAALLSGFSAASLIANPVQAVTPRPVHVRMLPATTKATACAAFSMLAQHYGNDWYLAQHYGNDGITIYYTFFNNGDPLPTGYSLTNCPTL